MAREVKMEEFSSEEQKYLKNAPYVLKPLQDWHFKDVLHFFKSSVTNDRACIKTISEREVDGALIAAMTDDAEMAAALNMSPIHVKKFRIKLKSIQERFSKDMEEEELELKAFLQDNSLGHLFNKLTIQLGIGTLAKLKEKVDNETLDTAGLRIKFAEEARLVKALSSQSEEYADEVFINSTKYKVAAAIPAGAKSPTPGAGGPAFSPVHDSGPGQVFMLKSAERTPADTRRPSQRTSVASTPRALNPGASPSRRTGGGSARGTPSRRV